MNLLNLLKLMAEIAQLMKAKPCLGIEVHADGGGRTTSATTDDDAAHGASKLEWDTPEEGAEMLKEELLKKLEMVREDHAEEPAP